MFQPSHYRLWDVTVAFSQIFRYRMRENESCLYRFLLGGIMKDEEGLVRDCLNFLKCPMVLLLTTTFFNCLTFLTCDFERT